MNVKRLAFWAVLFAALLAYTAVFEQGEGTPEPGADPVPDQGFRRLLSLPEGDVERIEIDWSGPAVALGKKLRGWQVLLPEAATLRGELSESLAAALQDAVIIDVIAENPVALETYGLTRPEFTVRIFGKGRGGPITLGLGDTSPDGTSMYVLQQEEGRVVLIGTYLRFCIKSFLSNLGTGP